MSSARHRYKAPEKVDRPDHSAVPSSSAASSSVPCQRVARIKVQVPSGGLDIMQLKNGVSHNSEKSRVVLQLELNTH